VVTGDSLREASGCTESPEIVADNKADWARQGCGFLNPLCRAASDMGRPEKRLTRGLKKKTSVAIISAGEMAKWHV
jgi:hypothetical protein